MIRIAMFSARIALSLIVGSAAFMLLVPLAMRERGYWAIGGEWVCVAFAVMLTFMLSHDMFEEETEDDE